jgi:DNA-directed RNA polymerase subunit RPC12/RpoP
MPSWVLQCIHCKSEFTHSLIDDMKMLSYMFPAKPEFPPAGAELECPNCGRKATYQRTDLTYRA